MGILSRLKVIMKANMNSSVFQADNPEKAIDEYIRQLNIDLGAVKAETSAILLSERRAKSALDECNAEIKKLQRYAEKSIEEGNDDKAAGFLEKKSQQTARLSELSAAYEQASTNAANIKLMQDKLVSDIGQLEARRIELKGKLAAAKGQGSLSSNHIYSALEEAEEKANYALDKAMALAELQAEENGDDLDQKFAQLEKEFEKNASTADELAALKDRLKKKE